MKNSKFILAMMVSVFCLNSQAGMLFTYSQLATKDLDQMNKMVNDKLTEAKKYKESGYVVLKETVQAVYARPNEDDMIEKVIAPLRSKLDEMESWEKSISQLTDEAINAVKNPRAFKPVVQVTYIIFLENLLAEVRPLVGTSQFENQIAVRIRDARIVVSKEAVNERKVRTMKDTTSPSEIADKILLANKTIPKVKNEGSSQ